MMVETVTRPVPAGPDQAVSLFFAALVECAARDAQRGDDQAADWLRMVRDGAAVPDGWELTGEKVKVRTCRNRHRIKEVE